MITATAIAMMTLAAAALPVPAQDAARIDPADACSGLALANLGAGVVIVSAATETAAPRLPDANYAGTPPAGVGNILPPFCKVIATSMPSRDSRIRVEVWLPLSDWNERLLGTGNGGYPVDIEHSGMSAGLARGFAVVGTDMGLGARASAGGGTVYDATEQFIGHPVRIRDFSTRATHEMTTIAKALATRFYARAPRFSYFAGCSTGGMQAFSEAQRFPGDYDGILAGSPGANRARVHLGVLWNFVVTWRRPDRVIPAHKLLMLHAAVLKSCPPRRTGQSFLDDPLTCRFDPRPLACSGGDAPNCLTREQLATAIAIYDGPRNPRTGERYSRGLPPGTELGWGRFMAAEARGVPFANLFKAALGRDLDMERFDWDHDAQSFLDIMAPQLDSFDAELAPFARRGGRLLIFYGGADWLTPVSDAADYVDVVQERGDAANAVRLFVLPGVDHCGGGLGPDQFDGLSLLMSWRERGKVPTTIRASAPGKEDTVSRPYRSRRRRSANFTPSHS